ncbi:MAG TPA: hypothetical protein VEQ35_01085 [Beijerinckia sp.]|jgi:hypothetical protein|nr:hypothetical protein [Beijerinckia sp.]
MIKALLIISLCSALGYSVTGLALAQAPHTQSRPVYRYNLPPDLRYEGRSVYRPGPDTFIGTDEKGYPTGRQENPQTGD